MGNFYEDNEDLRFYVQQWIDWEAILSVLERTGDPEAPASPHEARELYEEILSMVGTIAADEVAPRSARIDKEGHRLVNGEVVEPEPFRDIFRQLAETGLHGLNLPRELGGMNAPLMLYFTNAELFARGDVSVMTHVGFHGGIASALLAYSIEEGSSRFDPESGALIETRFRKEIEEIAAGEAWGAMVITEPDAGSDMGALRAKAEQDADGRWFVSGEKVFITSGHGKYHLVVARSEPREGLPGLSLFLVPAYEDGPKGRIRHVQIGRLEEKLGHHGSATCALVYDRSPAQLVGQRGEGFRMMLLLMNNARLAVGFESLGLMEAVHRLARSYAEERSAFGKPIARHELVADLLDAMRTDIEGIRALAMAGAFHEEMSFRLKLQLLARPNLPDAEREHMERERKRHAALARRATPLLKYVAAERAVHAARMGIQVHGGNGYMTEYGAEKLLRDALVLPIYEGTSQIQALMATRDRLKAILKDPQRFVRQLAESRLRSLSERDPLGREVARLQALVRSAEQHVLTRTAAGKIKQLKGTPPTEWARRIGGRWDPKRDFAPALLHAERLTRLWADESIARLLWKQARRHPERRAVLERHLGRALPRARGLHEEVEHFGDRLIVDLATTTSQAAAE